MTYCWRGEKDYYRELVEFLLYRFPNERREGGIFDAVITMHMVMRSCVIADGTILYYGRCLQGPWPYRAHEMHAKRFYIAKTY